MSDQAYAVRQSYANADLWRRLQPLLPHLDLELTERCNNACLHCYINLPPDDVHAKTSELSNCQWREIIRQAAELGALSVRFTGGEPLLRHDFADLYEFARRSGLRVTLFTNARLLTPALADLFARLPPLEKIQVTAYGLHPESYAAAACATDGYAEFRRGIGLLLDRQVPFIVKGAWLPPLRVEMAKFEVWAASLPWMDALPSYAMPVELRARRDSPARDRLIRSLRPHPEQVAALDYERPGYVVEMRRFCARFVGLRGPRLFDCDAGRFVSVDAYGRLQPCLLLRDPQLTYDLRQGCSIRPSGLREGLQDFFLSLGSLEATNPDYLERCGRCFLGSLCEQCPARSWVETGALDSPLEYHCQVAHARARRLGLLQPGERAWELSDWRSRLAQFQIE